MVKDGKLIWVSDIAIATFKGDRLNIPAHLVETAGFAGTERIECWLLVVKPGRYRLVPKSKADTDEDLSRILKQIEEVGKRGGVLDWTEDDEEPAIRVRLIDCAASPPGPGWRITFPKEATQLVPAVEQLPFVYMFSVAGYIEVWFPDTLRRADSVSISKGLP
jgi:hypothetical protein